LKEKENMKKLLVLLLVSFLLSSCQEPEVEDIEPDPVCDSEHLSLCSENECTKEVGGHWYVNTCMDERLDNFASVISWKQDCDTSQSDCNINSFAVYFSDNDEKLSPHLLGELTEEARSFNISGRTMIKNLRKHIIMFLWVEVTDIYGTSESSEVVFFSGF